MRPSARASYPRRGSPATSGEVRYRRPRAGLPRSRTRRPEVPPRGEAPGNEQRRFTRKKAMLIVVVRSKVARIELSSEVKAIESLIDARQQAVAATRLQSAHANLG